MSTGVDPGAFSNAFSRQLELGQSLRQSDQAEQARALQIGQAQRIAALNQNKAATPEDYVRAGDPSTGNALANIQDHDEATKAQAIPKAGEFAFQVLSITDPAARRSAFKQVVNANAPLFEALGTPHDVAMQKIDQSSDEELDQTLRGLATFAPQGKPITVGTDLVQQQPGGQYKPVYSGAGKVEYRDTGGELTPVDSVKGGVRTDLPVIKKTQTPYQTNTQQTAADLLTGPGLELAAQTYHDTGKLPTGLGKSAALVNSKVINRAAQIAIENGEDAKAAVLGRYAFQATQAAQKQTLREFTSGKAGNTVRSLNVAVQHLDQLSGLADALNNGDVPLVNKLGNAYAKQTGVAAPNTFDAMKKVVTDELVKAIVGAGGGVADREEAAQTISAQNSPAQLADVIKNYKGLMAGQLNGFRQQYTEGTGRQDFERFLLPSTRAELEAHDAANAQGAAGGAGQTPTPQTPAAAPAQPVVTPTSDAQYNALPSGAVYVGPDGKKRKKL